MNHNKGEAFTPLPCSETKAMQAEDVDVCQRMTGKMGLKKVRLGNDFVSGTHESVISAMSLTEQGGGVFAKSCSHRWVHGWLAVSCRKLGPGVIPTFVIVVLYVQVDQLGEVNAQSAAGVVYVLAIQGLYSGKNRKTRNPLLFHDRSEKE